MPHRSRSLASLARLLLLPAALALPLQGCDLGEGEPGVVDDPGLEQWTADLPEPVERDWDAITANDTIRALMTFNSTSYFLYRGEAMGYEFRALRAFAEEHGLTVEPRVVRNRTELFRLLNEGEGDVVAARLVPVPEFRRVVSFTRPLYRTRPTVVQQRAPLDSTPIPDPLEERVDSATGEEDTDYRAVHLQARLVRRPSGLAGDTVVLPRGSEYYERLVELRDTLDGTIELIELESALTEETLLRRVAAGSVRLTVTPENVAELSDEYFTNLFVQPVIGPKHSVAWAARTTSPVLRDSLDAWIEREREDELAELYQTYFVDRESYRERAESEYLTSETGQLSPYDSLIAAHAAELGWDWRLLASQAFQESRFDPRARSWAGARGLLQLMPATAREMGVSDPYDPEENVAGAVRYLEWLDERWADDFPDVAKRTDFILASYNAGFGHVEDAQRMAEKHGDDPKSWEDVSYWMLQLSKRRFYRDPVVRFGYVRGLEPVTYVSLVKERYDHYLEFLPETPPALAGEEAAEEAAQAGESVTR